MTRDPVSTLRFVGDPWRYPIMAAKLADEGGTLASLTAPIGWLVAVEFYRRWHRESGLD